MHRNPSATLTREDNFPMRLLRRHPILIVALGVGTAAFASLGSVASGAAGIKTVGPTLPSKTVTNKAGSGSVTTVKKASSSSGSSAKTASKSSSGANFFMSNAPAKRDIGIGFSSTTQVNLKKTGGFSSVVTITSSGSPKGVKLSYPARINSFAPVQITVGSTAKVGTYKITFTGKGGGRTHTNVFTLQIHTPKTSDTAGSGDTLPPVNGEVAPGLPTTVPGATSGAASTTVASGPTTTGLVRSLASTTVAPVAGATGSSTTVPGAVSTDFTVVVSPTRAALAVGGNTNLVITPAFPSATPSSVTYLVAGLPVGVNSSFSPNPSTGITTLSLSSPAGLAASTSNVVITAQAEGKIRQTQFELVLFTDVAITLSPSTVAAQPGASGLSTITVTPAVGFSANMTLAVAGLPTGITAVLSTPTLASGVSSLSLSVAATVPAGTYPFTVTGTGGGVTRTTAGTLSVAGGGAASGTTTTVAGVAANPAGELSVTSSPTARQVAPGTQATFALTLSGTGANGAIIAVSGAPAGAAVAVTPNPSTGSSSMIVTTAAGTPAGSYTLTVVATVGTTTRATAVTLIVG